ncbi:UNVERIFIED_CONTAM: hypothetical protein K2H54_035268 [Gekko kuhli]
MLVLWIPVPPLQIRIKPTTSTETGLSLSSLCCNKELERMSHQDNVHGYFVNLKANDQVHKQTLLTRFNHSAFFKKFMFLQSKTAIFQRLCVKPKDSRLSHTLQEAATISTSEMHILFTLLL